MVSLKPQGAAITALVPVVSDTRLRIPRLRLPLFGRAELVASLTDLVRGQDSGIVTLTGPGGAGKTHLATEVAARVEAEFLEGVAFVDLAPVIEPRLVLGAIAQALGVLPAPDRPLSAQLGAALQHRRLLLLLDNFEHLLDAAAEVAELVAACTRLSVLVTSRAPLRVQAERVVTVPPLAVPERRSEDRTGEKVTAAAMHTFPAVQLFVARARALAPAWTLTDSNAATIAAICRRLDGLPLAIELAAARSGVLGAADLLARLDGAAGGGALTVLTSGGRDRPTRQRTLRDTLAWSHDLLTLNEQALFRRLAVFAGGWTLSLAEAGCAALPPAPAAQTPAAHAAEVTAVDVLNDLQTLVDHQLVRRVDTTAGEARFAMLETIREFASEQLARSGEAVAMRAGHAELMLAWAEQATAGIESRDQPRWLARIEGEWPNLLAALTWLEGVEAVEPGLRLAAVLGPYWEIRGHATEGRRWLEGMLALAEHHGATDQARAAALLWAGRLETDDRVLAPAVIVQRLEQSLALYRALADDDGVIRTLDALAMACHLLGDTERSLALWDQAIAFARAGRHQWRLLASLIRSVWGLRDLGQLTARTAETVALARALGETRYLANGLLVQAHMLLTPRHVHQAEPLLQEAMALSRSVGDRSCMALIFEALGRGAEITGDLGRASAWFARGLALARDIAYWQGMANNIVGLLAVARRAGHLSHAAHLMGGLAPHRPTILGFLAGGLHVAFERTCVEVQAGLDEAAFTEAFAAGAALTWDDTVATALAHAASLADGTAAAAAEQIPTVAPGTTPLPGSTRSSSVAKSAVAPDGLTPREVEVLRLIAAGMTNPRIAAELVVSTKTVMHHSVNIYRKIGARGRAEATAYAIRTGLIDPSAR